MGDRISILHVLAILISDTQTMTKATNHLRNSNGKNELEKTKKCTPLFISKEILNKKGIVKEWWEMSTLQARMILKKDWFTDLEMLEICRHVSHKEYEQEPPTWTETQTTINQNTTNPS